MNELNQKYYGLLLWQWLAIAAGLYLGWKYVVQPVLTTAPAPASQSQLLLPAPADTSAANFATVPGNMDAGNFVAAAGPPPLAVTPVSLSAIVETPVRPAPVPANAPTLEDFERLPNVWGRG